MYGDGPDVSIIRESANKGGDTGATACKMLYITATGTNVAESVTVRDLTFDKNGANTPLPSPDTKYERRTPSPSISKTRPYCAMRGLKIW